MKNEKDRKALEKAHNSQTRYDDKDLSRNFQSMNDQQTKGLVMVKELIRPQTREYAKYSSTRDTLIP